MEKKLRGVWSGMKTRCTNPNFKNYPYYGGRGIKVCTEWMASFSAFYEWAISNGFENGLSLDRIDVNGDYSPTNCRWADWSTQMKNRRNNNPNRKGLKYSTKYDLTLNGETKNASEWADVIGVSAECIRKRFKKNPDPKFVLKELVS